MLDNDHRRLTQRTECSEDLREGGGSAGRTADGHQRVDWRTAILPVMDAGLPAWRAGADRRDASFPSNLAPLLLVRERRRYCRRAEGTSMKRAFGTYSWAALPLPPQEWGGSLASK